MDQGYDKTSDMWLNDPQVCRDADPHWDEKIEKANFDYNMRKGTKPNDAYRDPTKRERYVAFLRANNSSLADRDD
jgi:hypothetical protein